MQFVILGGLYITIIATCVECFKYDANETIKHWIKAKVYLIRNICVHAMKKHEYN